MIYFSELKGKKVFSEDLIEIGRLEDLIFSVSETPKVTKLQIKDRSGRVLNIPTSYIKKINPKKVEPAYWVEDYLNPYKFTKQ